ncbi:single-stranded-DNA-specific exonuclease RecJ [Ahrensia kielensis]|uniref:single-stranded-DNA-specific exonuclease RecJ n=1 Tax=Ahrensia kielensis TaxID=76980 RepID=UPI00037ACB41|nr:single-stranded-DNA-specific exonuclease RecJ [Ahrensia kielensis]
MAQTFLDIENSAGGRRWIERLSAPQKNIALDIAQTHGVPDILARVLAARGVHRDEVKEFLDPTIKALMPDPRTITDMEAAAARIAQAINAKEKVAIFGDYDVDGAGSSALMARYLGHFGLQVEIYIPDRIYEGYGPNAAAMKALAERNDFIITVDCGTNSAEAFSAIDDTGIDIVVLDHHQVGGALPAIVAVVNPNREDDISGLGHLCAGGVVFMSLVEVSRQLRASGRNDLPDLMRMLDLVALTTVCDVVPLIGLNRAFVAKGLVTARHQTNLGIAALASVARIGEPINPFHFGFAIGPRINAGGRIGDASLGAKLLTETDPDRAAEIAKELNELNAQRQAIEVQMVEEAKAEAERELQSASPPAIIVTASESWHPGIAGLIASRLKDSTRRPSFAIALGRDGKGTGSGRSIPGFDLGKVVRMAVESGLLIKGGGHAMAAGITVEKSKLGALRAFFDDQAASAVQELVNTSEQKIDGALSARGCNITLIELLNKAGPYGAGNPEPVFVLPHHMVAFSKPVGQGHLKVALRAQDGAQIDAIAFRAVDSELGKILREGKDRPIHVAGTLSANHWNGRVTPQLRIVDAAMPV